MNRNEALKACIDGAKITHPEHYDDNDYVYYRNGSFWFVFNDGSEGILEEDLGHEDGYEIYEEPKNSGGIEKLKQDHDCSPHRYAYDNRAKINELIETVNTLVKGQSAT